METKISGVYMITNKVTGDCYIGSSKNIKRRWASHKCISTWTRHPNLIMYQAMAQYGLDNFEFEILEETDDLRNREQYFIDLFNPQYNNYRANGWDLERHNEWYKLHREDNIVKCKKWKEANREKFRTGHKKCNGQLCLYKGKMLTINALSQRFHNQGIPHAWLEAKKYLV